MNALYIANAIKHIFHASFHAFQVSTLENKVTTLELVRHFRTVCCNGSNSRLYHTCHVSLIAFLSSFLPQTVQKVSCSSNPCQNGGTCLNLLNSYHCVCPGNWAVSSTFFCYIMGVVITIINRRQWTVLIDIIDTGASSNPKYQVESHTTDYIIFCPEPKKLMPVLCFCEFAMSQFAPRKCNINPKENLKTRLET